MRYRWVGETLLSLIEQLSWVFVGRKGSGLVENCESDVAWRRTKEARDVDQINNA